MGFQLYIKYLNQNKGYLFSVASLSHLTSVNSQILQNALMAANVGNPSNYESVLVRFQYCKSGCSIQFNLHYGSTTNAYSNLRVLAVDTWQVLFVSLSMVYVAIRSQRYYFLMVKS